MKKRFLLIVSIGVFGFGNLAAQQNLIANPDLEIWNGSTGEKTALPTGFDFNSNVKGTGFFTKSSNGQGYGNTGFCLRLETKISKPSTGTATTQTSKITFPETDFGIESCYEFSYFGKGVARNSIFQFSLTGEQMVPFHSYNISSGWQKYTGSFVYTPTAETQSTGRINIRLYDVKTTYYFFDKIAVVKVPDNLATIRSIGLREPQSDFGSYIPNFSPDVFEYNVDLWYGTDTVPALIIDPTNKLSTVVSNYDQIKNFAEGESTKELIITVTSRDGSETNTYTINFNRNNFVLGGLAGDVFTNSERGIAESINLTTNIQDNSNSVIGAYSIRPTNSDAEETYLITKTLPNGAKDISFKTGFYSVTGSASVLQTAITNGDKLIVAVHVAEDGTNFEFVDEYTIDFNTSKWEEVKFDINSSSPNTKVKIEYLKEGETSSFLPFMLDDIVITPYNQSSSIDRNLNSAQESLQVYAQNGAIVIEEQAPYQVYSIGGQLVATGINQSDKTIVSVQKGLYIVKVLDRTKKISVQ